MRNEANCVVDCWGCGGKGTQATSLGYSLGLEFFEGVEGAVEGSLDLRVVAHEVDEVFFAFGHEADGQRLAVGGLRFLFFRILVVLRPVLQVEHVSLDLALTQSPPPG